eukprot:5727768-Pyramimonas_sp.AAC.1
MTSLREPSLQIALENECCQPESSADSCNLKCTLCARPPSHLDAVLQGNGRASWLLKATQE